MVIKLFSLSTENDFQFAYKCYNANNCWHLIT